MTLLGVDDKSQQHFRNMVGGEQRSASTKHVAQLLKPINQPTNHTHSHTRKMLLKQETYTLPTPASASHQWTESTNPSYNQWLSQL